jgi:hypothetical protein
MASSAFAAISIFNDYTDAYVSDGTNQNDSYYFNTGGTTAIATLPTGYASQTDSNYSTFGDSAAFTAVFNHLRQGDFFGQAYSQIEVDFTTAVAGAYTASGAYSNAGGFTIFSSFLYDSTANAYVYNNYQESIGAPASFVLGGTGGNSSNTWSGSLTGTLPAGHSFQWSTIVATVAYPTADSGALAGGGVTLTIQAAVPEFSSAIVWSLLAVTMCGTIWWQRSKLLAA